MKAQTAERARQAGRNPERSVLDLGLEPPGGGMNENCRGIFAKPGTRERITLMGYLFLCAAQMIPVIARSQNFSVGEILTRSERALGGARAIGSVHRYTLTASMEGLSGFPGTLRVSAERPGKRRVEWEIHYIAQARGFDGKGGWERNADVRELQGAELQRAARASAFMPIEVVRSYAAGARVTEERDPDGRSYYALRFTDGAGWSETVFFDAHSFLPVRESRSEPYEDGAREINLFYGDYRRVGHVLLPFSIQEKRPDLSFVAKVQSYKINPTLDSQLFANPNEAHFGEPYTIDLATIPRHVYSERKNIWDESRFWGMYYPPTDSWTFDLVVNEQYGRSVEPLLVRIDSYFGNGLVSSVTLPQEALRRLIRFPVARFAPQPEIFNLRHDVSQPATLSIDRMVYTIQVRTPTGAIVEKALSIPVEHYQLKHRLIFPVKGNFMVVTGHEAEELNHKYEWSQHYAFDIVALGPQMELQNHDGTFYGFARTEVIAPAAGTVVFARNDVPDDLVKNDYLKLADGKWAIGGNIVLLDHGEGEYSLFAHMHQGSVRVKKGDTVKQGDVIGLLGSSGSPGNPHLHYQLQDNPGLFEGDGLPSEFVNVKPSGWYEKGPFETIKRGVYLKAD